MMDLNVLSVGKSYWRAFLLLGWKQRGFVDDDTMLNGLEMSPLIMMMLMMVC